MVRLYLDQCHWSDIARAWANPADVQRLMELAAEGQVQHVLSIAHIIETLQCKQAAVRRRLMDALSAARVPVWIKSKDLIIRQEIVAYFHEFVGCTDETHLDPFCSDLFTSVGARRPALFPRRRRMPSVKRLFRFIRQCPPRQRKRLLSVCEADACPTRGLFHARAGPASTKALSAFLDLHLPKTLPGGSPVGARLKRAFLVQFDLAKCPALMNLIWIAHHMSRAGVVPTSGDILDLYHAVPAYTYCDVFVTDKRVADYIRRLRNPRARFAAVFRSLPEALRHIKSIL